MFKQKKEKGIDERSARFSEGPLKEELERDMDNILDRIRYLIPQMRSIGIPKTYRLTILLEMLVDYILEKVNIPPQNRDTIKRLEEQGFLLHMIRNGVYGSQFSPATHGVLSQIFSQFLVSSHGLSWHSCSVCKHLRMTIEEGRTSAKNVLDKMSDVTTQPEVIGINEEVILLAVHINDVHLEIVLGEDAPEYKSMRQNVLNAMSISNLTTLPSLSSDKEDN